MKNVENEMEKQMFDQIASEFHYQNRGVVVFTLWKKTLWNLSGTLTEVFPEICHTAFSYIVYYVIKPMNRIFKSFHTAFFFDYPSLFFIHSTHRHTFQPVYIIFFTFSYRENFRKTCFLVAIFFIHHIIVFSSFSGLQPNFFSLRFYIPMFCINT